MFAVLHRHYRFGPSDRSTKATRPLRLCRMVLIVCSEAPPFRHVEKIALQYGSRSLVQAAPHKDLRSDPGWVGRLLPNATKEAFRALYGNCRRSASTRVSSKLRGQCFSSGLDARRSPPRHKSPKRDGLACRILLHFLRALSSIAPLAVHTISMSDTVYVNISSLFRSRDHRVQTPDATYTGYISDSPFHQAHDVFTCYSAPKLL